MNLLTAGIIALLLVFNIAQYTEIREMRDTMRFAEKALNQIILACGPKQ